MSLRDALGAAARLGAEVAVARRTGEVRVRTASGGVLVNGRRRDAPRVLVVFLKRLEERGRVTSSA